MPHRHTRVHEGHTQDTWLVARSFACVCSVSVCICARGNAAIEPPDYPPQFDLMRYAATREKVNYAVNESLNIYTLRGVGMSRWKRGIARSTTRFDCWIWSLDGAQLENDLPFSFRFNFKYDSARRPRTIVGREGTFCGVEGYTFSIALKLVWISIVSSTGGLIENN